MKENEKYQLAGAARCRRVINDNPTYKVFWRSGFAFRGAAEREEPRDEVRREYDHRLGIFVERTFEERMERAYDWAAAIDVVVLHDKNEIHLNGYSCNDLY